MVSMGSAHYNYREHFRVKKERFHQCRKLLPAVAPLTEGEMRNYWISGGCEDSCEGATELRLQTDGKNAH